MRQGAKVLVADIDEEGGQGLAEELGEGATFVRCDVTQEADVAAAVREVVTRWGQLSIMCNNAGKRRRCCGYSSVVCWPGCLLQAFLLPAIGSQLCAAWAGRCRSAMAAR